MKIKKILLILFVLAELQPSLFSQSQYFCKERLSETINSYQPTIVPVLTIDGKYLFVSRKLHPDNIGSVYDNDDIWISERANNYSFSELRNLGIPVNTIESNVLFSVTPSSKALIHSSKPNNQQLFYFASIDDSIITNIEAINITNYYNKSENYFANLSANENILFLALQRDDSYGDMDLYISFFNKDKNSFSEPKNLGTRINTSKIETSPFLAYDNRTLYFSSNRNDGLGGLDLYFTRRLDDTWLNWSEPVNLGMRINSNFDDKSIYLTALSDSALIVSSDSNELRPGIYYVCLPKELKPQPYSIVCGNIYLNKTGNPFRNQISLEVTNKQTKERFTTASLFAKPYYYITLPNEYEYVIEYFSEGKKMGSFNVNQQNKKEIAFVNKDLIVKEEVKSEIKTIDKTIIYFDLDLAEIKEKDIETLFQLVKKSKNLSNFKLKITGHTDSIGTENHNEELSKQRALKVKNFLVSNGINPKSIVVEWKAAKEPISAKDEENRRVEIEFVK